MVGPFSLANLRPKKHRPALPPQVPGAFFAVIAHCSQAYRLTNSDRAHLLPIIQIRVHLNIKQFLALVCAAKVADDAHRQ